MIAISTCLCTYYVLAWGYSTEQSTHSPSTLGALRESMWLSWMFGVCVSLRLCHVVMSVPCRIVIFLPTSSKESLSHFEILSMAKLILA